MSDRINLVFSANKEEPFPFPKAKTFFGLFRGKERNEIFEEVVVYYLKNADTDAVRKYCDYQNNAGIDGVISEIPPEYRDKLRNLGPEELMALLDHKLSAEPDIPVNSADSNNEKTMETDVSPSPEIDDEKYSAQKAKALRIAKFSAKELNRTK